MTNGFVQSCMCVCVCAHTHAQNTLASLNAVRSEESDTPPVKSVRRIKRKLLQGCAVGRLCDRWMTFCIKCQIRDCSVSHDATSRPHRHARKTQFRQLFCWYVVIKSHVVVSISQVGKFRQRICIFAMFVTLAELNSIWCREFGVAECHDTAMI